MIKKIYFLLAFFLLFYVSEAQNGRWQRLIDKPTFDIALNPKNHNTIYAGGGERLVYRSYDNGITWDTLIVRYIFPSAMLNNVVPNPEDTNNILVGGLNFGSICRTTNQGETWDIVLSKIHPIELNGKSMVYKPGSVDTVYAGDFRYATIYRSTNRGETWDSISSVQRWRKKKLPDGTFIDTLVYTTVGALNIRTDSSNIILLGSTAGEMFISTDAGITWTYTDQITNTADPSGQFDSEVTRIVFSDRDPRVGYCVITYLFYGNKPNGGLHKTTDGGYTWDMVAFPDTSLWACDVRGFGDEDEVFVGGYTEDFYVKDTLRVPGVGIVRRSQDGGKTWFNYDNSMNWFLEEPRSNSPFNCVYFPNADTGYIVGDYGNIIKTTDAGATWSNLLYPNKYSFSSVFFTDSFNGYVCSNEGFLLSTTNAGVKWNEVTLPVKEILKSITFTDKQTGYIAGYNGTILKTTDATNWVKLNTNINDNLLSVYFSDNNTGFACGENGTILKTLNAGSEWLKLNTNTTSNLHSIFFYDNDFGLCVGETGTVLETTDGGENWSAKYVNTDLNLHSVSIPDLDYIYITGDYGLVFRSIDRGNNWLKIDSKNSRNLHSSFFTSPLTGYIVGKYGTLIQTTDGGDKWSIPLWGNGPRANMWSLRFLGTPGEEKLYMATEAGLFVLDNPSDIFNDKVVKYKSGNLIITHNFNDILNIKYYRQNLNFSERFKLNIYDILGNIIYHQDYQNTNEIIEFPVNVRNFPAGTYLISIIDGSSVTAGKFIIGK